LEIGQVIKVLNKAFGVLEYMTTHDGDVGVTELGRALSLNKVTAYRLLQSLSENGYVERGENGDRYRLTIKLWELGNRLAAPRSFSEAALPALRQLAAFSGETAYVAVLSDAEAIFLEKVDSTAAVRVHTPLGARIPLHCGSASKALLAFQPEAIVRKVCRRLTPMTPFTITDPDLLRADLARVRERGFATGDQEWRVGISGVAAPVRDEAGAVVAAVALSGPTERFHIRRQTEVAPQVLNAAQDVSMRLGWRPK
jgi:DNA-binding IclR family transcriptional regulator